MTIELPDAGDCVFCAIVAGDSEARWEVRPDVNAPDDTVVACFHNQLKWERIMLLVVPTQHMTQSEFWSSPVLRDAAALAVEMGEEHCSSDGYRVISNFGRVAHQSQVHAHMHVVSGTSDQLDQARKTSAHSVAAESLPWGTAAGSSGPGGSQKFEIAEYEVDEVPRAVRLTPVVSPAALPVTQRDFWRSESILGASRAAQQWGEQYSASGYRLISNFEPAGSAKSTAGNNPAGLFLLGGGQLGLYV